MQKYHFCLNCECLNSHMCLSAETRVIFAGQNVRAAQHPPLRDSATPYTWALLKIYSLFRNILPTITRSLGLSVVLNSQLSRVFWVIIYEYYDNLNKLGHLAGELLVL